MLGSNIFNLLAVLGLSGIVAPAGLPVSDTLLRFDMPVIIAVAVACLPIFASGALVARWEDALFLLYYIALTTYLVLGAQQHDALPVFSATIQAFALPLAVVTPGRGGVASSAETIRLGPLERRQPRRRILPTRAGTIGPGSPSLQLTGRSHGSQKPGVSENCHRQGLPGRSLARA